MKNLSAEQLYLHCEECEDGWHNPHQVDDLAAGFLTLLQDFEAEPATWEEIEKAGWQQYATNVDEK